jgi:hypothetical protein
MRAEEDETMATSKIVWREVTRNCHVGSLDDIHVVTVVRSQNNRPDGTKYDWRIEVLNDPHSWNRTFCQYDPRDLESTKSAAEMRTKWAIECLYKALKGRKAA